MEKAIIKRPILAAVKLSGKFTAEERKYLREKAWRKSTDGATMTMTSTDFGRESLLFFDVYIISKLFQRYKKFLKFGAIIIIGCIVRLCALK